MKTPEQRWEHAHEQTVRQGVFYMNKETFLRELREAIAEAQQKEREYLIFSLEIAGFGDLADGFRKGGRLPYLTDEQRAVFAKRALGETKATVEHAGSGGQELKEPNLWVLRPADPSLEARVRELEKHLANPVLRQDLERLFNRLAALESWRDRVCSAKPDPFNTQQDRER